mmetsp:Transcript_3564/g.7155  ORF Transcript_3564/g.7155 Transcript_3564/m.7155 type:complete len:96 (-) Transcript_3564:323-610(-)|eukprot:CAMPEP_0167776208 /NCGR_PEP_ID=MMETSP0111_2-20121227/2997_1 /TAXON_ID=91324 /ORGANISM="Lotharella globosa, Strain CCCM811" /LENGTH=95 /DNA_ID=CAMNT_0007666229 /DNA_START=65 /DNA_END=352 /DNA_ORIENTATION=+
MSEEKNQIQEQWNKLDKNSATVPLAMFGTAVAGGVALFKYYRPQSNPTIRFARARILAQGTLIACLGTMALMGLSGNDGKKKGRVTENIDLSKRH